MDLKLISIFSILAAISLLNYTSALPRDVGGANIETVSQNLDLTMKVKDVPNETGSEALSIPGRVRCPYEEAIEYPSCQEHCLPKGYSHGICVSRTCSCI